MTDKNKKEIRILLGRRLKEHREQILIVRSARQLAVSHKYDGSKLSKLEKGLLDFRFNSLIDIALIYQLSLPELLNFTIPFWPDSKKAKRNTAG